MEGLSTVKNEELIRGYHVSEPLLPKLNRDNRTRGPGPLLKVEKPGPGEHWERPPTR